MDDDRPYVNVVYSSLPPLALLELYETFPEAPDRSKWLDALKLHLEEYLFPMAQRNAYRIIPLGLFLGKQPEHLSGEWSVEPPTPENYRIIDGLLLYRYFMPTRKGFGGWEQPLISKETRYCWPAARSFVPIAPGLASTLPTGSSNG
jgi:hypothetical protein